MKTRAAAVTALLACLLVPANLSSCAIPFEQIIFVTQQTPDQPWARYAGGDLGIVLPTYAPSFLVVAYRYMNEAPLSKQEQSAALAFWQQRPPADPDSGKDPDQPRWGAAYEKWMAERGVIADVPAAAIDREQQTDYFNYYVNCTASALTTAADTLNDLVSRYGAANPWVKDWVVGQEAVFSNCNNNVLHIAPASGGEEAEVAPPSMPQPAPAGAPAWLLADRAYQIAAAEFYVGQYDDAALRFRQIAADPNSPWHELAGYLVARAYIRQATMGRDESASRVSMEAAEKQLIAILADSRLAAVHHRSRMLLDLVEARLHPAEYAGELGRRLARDDPDFEHDAGDLTLVLRRLSGRDAITMARASDLADWLNAFRSNDPSVPAYALKRWQSTHSAAWLAMAIAKAKSGDPGVADLLAAAASLPQASPASATVEFHRIRLLIAQNETGEARRLLQADLERPSLPLSALNSFKSERMQVAANLDDFLRFAQLPPAGLQGEFETAGMPGDSKDPHARLAISDEAARALSHLFPMRLLADAAQSSILVPHLHRDLALAAWTRSALLPAQQEIAVRLASTVAAADPSLAADMQAYRRTISESHSAAARQFAGAFLILQLPGLQPAVRPGFQRSTWGPGSDEGIRQIDNFRDNCWCSLKPPAPNSMNPQPAPAPPAIAFLNDQDRAAASREWNELEAQGAGPDALASAVLAYARHNPDDSRIPQALHLVVHAGRFGCNDEATGPLIHAAFGLLHSRYGQTEWAKKTPYWFK